MADKTEFDSRLIEIPKGVPGSENSIPLSPQWLLPKSGDVKAGVVTGENHFSSLEGHANRPDTMKLTGMGDNSSDINKRKDVFRPSVLDMESGRRDHWLDEERDTNSMARRDRWRERERENTDNRRVDRWTDSSGKHHGEARRAPGERWNDSGNKDSHDQRRESKWNTRWGPDDKDADAVREKWGDSIKEADASLHKGSFHPYDGKDERDGDHHRPWRSNSSHSRGRADPHHQVSTPNKQVPTFSHGRGRGESISSAFSLGRGKPGSGGNMVTQASMNLEPHGSFVEKIGSGNGEPYYLNYSRIKLIDMYRTADVRSCAKYLEGIVRVPSLTQDEPIEPLAFCAPSPEELVILKGIDKGEILSSGAPQISKDASAGKTTDYMQSRRNRLGSKDDLPVSYLDDSKDETLNDNPKDAVNYTEGLSHEERNYAWPKAKGETGQVHEALSGLKMNAEAKDQSVHRKDDGSSATRESSAPGHSSILQSSPWRSSSFGERSYSSSLDWRERSNDVQNDLKNSRENSMDIPNTNKGPKWQMGDNSILRRQPSAVDRDMELHKITQPSPEDLVLIYKDPQDEIQGPFAGSDIISWFESGYFGIDLQVRLASAPADSPFCLLGDVMPHLGAKARPPPGFSTPKPNEIQDASSRLSYSSLGTLNALSTAADMLTNESRFKFGSTKEAENRFLESLMAGNPSTSPLQKFALSKGLQEYGGNNSSALLPVGSNSGEDPYLFAKRMTLERQRSLTNPYSVWPGRDAASLTNVNDASLAHSMFPSSAAENVRVQQLSQNVDLMSVLQGIPDRSTSNANNGVGGWLNFSDQGRSDPFQDELDVHPNQILPQSAFGMKQQRLQLQSPSVPSMLGQSLENASHLLTPEKLLSSGLSQDPQLLNLLQQQYLLQQLHIQAPVPPPQQLSALDKFLLLKQQQKQEEQQQLLRQQQLLSEVLSEHRNQQLCELPFAQLQSGSFAMGNAKVDNAHFQQPHDLFQMSSQQAPNARDENANSAEYVLPPSVSQEFGANINSETSIHPSHQIFANNIKQRNWDTSPKEQNVNKQHKGASMPAEGFNMTSEEANKWPLEHTSYYDEHLKDGKSDTASSFPVGEQLEELVSEKSRVSCESEVVYGNLNALAETLSSAFEEHHISEPSPIKEVKSAEPREVKKSSEKKSRKQKSLKVSSDLLKGLSKSQQSKSSEFEGTKHGEAKFDALAVQGDAALHVKDMMKSEKLSANDVDVIPGQNALPVLKYADGDWGVEIVTNGQPGQVVSQLNDQTQAGQRAWKPAPGFKPKSLLEIQQEEQRRAREEMTVSEISTSVSSISASSPWAGVLNADHKSFSESRSDTADTVFNAAKSESIPIPKIKNTQDNLFWDIANMSKLGEREMEVSDSPAGVPFASIMSSITDNNDFIEAKDTKKSRKKSAKAKSGVSKVAPAASVDAYFGSSPSEKAKHNRQLQQEKEVLPALPSGPSLGDYVVWKEEPASPSPAPAWSTDSGKLNKPTSLRDILKEQGKKVSSSAQPIQTPPPQKPIANQPTRGSTPSWSFSTSPAKDSTGVRMNSLASSNSKHTIEDDLFWGPEEQSKPEAKQSDFPVLGTQSSGGSKNIPVKENLRASLNRQKSTGGKPTEYSLAASASPAQSSQKGKKKASSKHSEAMDFREWCESECSRLIGSKDTSFLEFCLKQSREEAEMLLTENLGSIDTDREFIDKFLNYKDFLPADVLEMAFKIQNDRKSTAVRDVTTDNTDVEVGGFGSAGATDGVIKGGKKKGKKGKKVSPSVLGFNVVSNRIMMGEIQTIQD